MRRSLGLTVLLLVALLVPLLALPNASASELANAGTKTTFDDSTIGWFQTYDGSIAVINVTGNVTVFDWKDGERQDQWSVYLNETVICAAIDNLQHRLAIGTTNGVEVISTEYQEVLYSINTGEATDSLAWDGDGDLWVGLANSNQAVEYRDTGATGTLTISHTVEVSAILGLPGGGVVTTGRDLIIRVNHPNGSQNRVLMDITSVVTDLALVDGGQTMLAMTESGKVFVYSTDNWTLEDEVTLSSGGMIHSMAVLSDGRIAMGTHNGHLHVINGTDYSEISHVSNLGNIVGIHEVGPNSFLVLASFIGSSQVILFDVDTDGDGVVDSDDPFPTDSTQQVDSDGDGYGDNQLGNNPDEWPADPSQWVDSDGDGRGDNANGTNGDQFPNNADQNTDSDGDGYGDNSLGLNGDYFPNDDSQWFDSDGDGLGDNLEGTNPDDCPNSPGDSHIDREGCPDSDDDGYSDASEDFPACSALAPNGADSYPMDSTQWCDTDQDNYGDNLTGNKPDWCPAEWGNSTRGIYFDTGENRYVTVQRFGCPDRDGDGYEDSGEHDGLTDWSTDPTEWVDSDRDGVGDNSDWDDLDPTVATEEEYCAKHPDDYAVCSNVYVPTNVTEDPEEELNPSEKRNQLVKEFLIYGGGIGVGLIAAILILWGLIGLIRTTMAKRSPDAQYSHQDATKELQADEEGEEFSTRGGITQEKGWEGEALGDGITEDQLWDMAEDIDDEQPSVAPDAGDFGDDDTTSEPPSEPSEGDEAEAEVESEPEPEPEPEPESTPPEPSMTAPADESAPASDELPPGAPPIPDGGLPAGWTMEQWVYYGHQWWDAKNQE